MKFELLFLHPDNCTLHPYEQLPLRHAHTRQTTQNMGCTRKSRTKISFHAQQMRYQKRLSNDQPEKVEKPGATLLINALVDGFQNSNIR